MSGRVELDLCNIEPWKPTIGKIRDCILSRKIGAVQLPASLVKDPLAREFAPSPKDVETINDLAAEAVAAGRLIDFGFLPNEIIKEGGTRGGPMYSAGALGHPFSGSWVMYHEWEEGVSCYLVSLLETDMQAGGDTEVVELEPVTLLGQPHLMVGDRVILEPHTTDERSKLKYRARAIPSMFRYVASLAEMNNNGDIPGSAAGNLLDPLMTGLLLLSTDGVPRRTISVPEKLNRARQKSRKPPIPSHEEVGSAMYVTALTARRGHKGPGLGGTHASPVPHLRRGHTRVLASGVRCFVRDSLVSMSAEAKALYARSHYVVRSP